MLLGVKDDSGIDVYFLVMKLWLGILLGYNLFINFIVWYIKVNVFGLFGFGFENNDSVKFEWEGFLVVLISFIIVIGIEFRM